MGPGLLISTIVLAVFAAGACSSDAADVQSGQQDSRGERDVPGDEFAGDYVVKPDSWDGRSLGHALVEPVEAVPIGAFRLDGPKGNRVAVASLSASEPIVTPFGGVFGLEGRDLYPSSLVAQAGGLRAVLLACEPPSSPDACLQPSIEVFDFPEGEDWVHAGAVQLEDFELSSWPALTGVAHEPDSMVLAVSNVEIDSSGTPGAVLLRLSPDLEATVLDRSNGVVRSMCPSGDSAVALVQDGDTPQVELVRPGEAEVNREPMGSDVWALGCDPLVALGAAGATRLADDSMVPMPAGAEPASSSQGVLLVRGTSGTSVDLVNVADGKQIASYDIGRPYGPTSAVGSQDGSLVAVDVDPPDGVRLPLWTRG